MYQRYWYSPKTVTVIKSHNFQSVCAFPIPYTSAEIKSDDSHSPITWINLYLPASNGTTRKKIIMKKSIAIKIEKNMYSFDKFCHNNLFLCHISLVQLSYTYLKTFFNSLFRFWIHKITLTLQKHAFIYWLKIFSVIDAATELKQRSYLGNKAWICHLCQSVMLEKK